MDPWEQMISGLRAGDSVATADFFRSYGPALERIAAGRIEDGMRRRVGAETIAHSVCRTFLRRAQANQFSLGDSDSLWRLLCAITLNKVREKARFHLRQKRGVDREVHLDSMAEPGDIAPDRQPTPEEAAIFAEAFESVVASLGEDEGKILELRLQEKTHEQIAAELGCSERTVRRMLGAIRDRLAAAFEA